MPGAGVQQRFTNAIASFLEHARWIGLLSCKDAAALSHSTDEGLSASDCLRNRIGALRPGSSGSRFRRFVTMKGNSSIVGESLIAP